MLSAAAEEEKLHQVTFNTNHVLCSCCCCCWLLDPRGGQRTEDTQFNMMDYRTGLLLLTVCWAERRTEDRRHTV
ncbi:hypothetical protein F7725_003657 [Dissostichus mawsoni]|uniref:Uncharacterized protein n=1 Tax=Dissostichus mawsoni TaxID=36200 RepID=A0A7J5YCT6_DISMA|nr:hypothetical protein F7725_003657 [Dissostichus mawsoni]